MDGYVVRWVVVRLMYGCMCMLVGGGCVGVRMDGSVGVRWLGGCVNGFVGRWVVVC